MTISIPKRRKRQPIECDGKPHPGRRMTEREFVAWADDKTRAEWVDGEVIIMPPVNSGHDNLQGWLRSLMMIFVEVRDLGQVKGPEFTIRLPRQRRRRLPDLLFVAKDREQIILPNHVEGSPDLIVEIVSADSIVRDWREKYLEYERAGVREYWVIDVANERVEIYGLGKNGKYQRVEEGDGRISSAVLKGFYLRTKWVLGGRLPSLTSVLREMGIRV